MSKFIAFVDTGGTFTDCLVVKDGKLFSSKVLSSSEIVVESANLLSSSKIEVTLPTILQGYNLKKAKVRIGKSVYSIRKYEKAKIELADSIKEKVDTISFILPIQAPIIAIHSALSTPLSTTLPPYTLILSTTIATNTLLEKKANPVVLYITEGFRDILEINDQRRRDLFELPPQKSGFIPYKAIEIKERINSLGEIVEKLVLPSEIPPAENPIAISFMNSFVNSIHENTLANFLHSKNPSLDITLSSAISPLIGFLERTKTAVINAYVSPNFTSYVKKVKSYSKQLYIMTSSGVVLQSEKIIPKEILISGPAAGVIGSAEIAKLLEIKEFITFDMGGTSTDVCYIGSSSLPLSPECTVGNIKISSPSISVETIAAGGGSICKLESGLFKVGPESAGADPGPACYGKGGFLTITDLNLVLGRLSEDNFQFFLRKDASFQKLAELENKLNSEGIQMSKEEIAQGFIDIANEKMAGAIKKIVTSRGADPSKATLIAYGGAAGQHVCAIAELLDIRKVIIPAHLGILSALGLAFAKVGTTRYLEILKPVDKFFPYLKVTVEKFKERLLAELGEKFSKNALVDLTLLLRIKGQENSLPITYTPSIEEIKERFKNVFFSTYGFFPKESNIELHRILGKAYAPVSTVPAKHLLKTKNIDREASKTNKTHTLWSKGKMYKAKVIWKNALDVEEKLEEPSIILDRYGTIILDQGWVLQVDEWRNVILEKKA